MAAALRAAIEGGLGKKAAGSGEPSCSNEPTHSFELITSLSHTGSPARPLEIPLHRPWEMSRGKSKENEDISGLHLASIGTANYRE